MTDHTVIERPDSALANSGEAGAASQLDQLYRWIEDRRPEGYCPAQVFTSMLSAGWTRQVGVDALRHVMGDALTEREYDCLLRGTPMPNLEGSPTTVTVEGHEVQVLFEMHNPRIIVFGGFMTDDECDQIIEIARSRLERSTVVADTNAEGNVLSDIRTSYGTFLTRGEFDVCNRIDARAQALVNWPTDFTEDLQVLHYKKGAEYKAHQDFFDAPDGPWTPALTRGGNRCGTLLTYLNTPTRGGGTLFPDVPLEVRARKGLAVYFSYPVADASSRTTHAALPVIEGEKWAAVKWFRQGPHR
jgi:prolyl 4-hydroxylase